MIFVQWSNAKLMKWSRRWECGRGVHKTGSGMSNYKPLRLPNYSQSQSKENNKIIMCRAVRKTLTTSIDALAMLATASAHAEVKSKPSPIAGVVATRDNARGTVDQIAESFPMAR